jgi:hypothetical protein
VIKTFLRLRLKRTIINSDSNFTKEKEMADFRKWFLVLAVLALAFSANAQTPYACTAVAGVTPIVRAEGLAELVGDLQLNCTGQVPAAGITANIQIFLNTNVTSDIVSGSTGTEAILLTDDVVTSLRHCTLVPNNSLVWLGVQLADPAGAPYNTTKSYRITNVRANATLIPASTGVPNVIQEFISISGSQSVTLSNPVVTVAFVQPGLTFSAGDEQNFQQCVGLNVDLPDEGTAADVDTAFELSYAENFATAFKERMIPDSIVNPTTTTNPATQATPGIVYNTETGLVLGSATEADTATRLFARFSNVPTGVRIFVTTRNTDSSGAVFALVSNNSASTASTTFTQAGTLGGVPLAEVALSGGVGEAVWEVAARTTPAVATTDPAKIETVTFGMAVGFPENLAITTTPTATAGVQGGFAPISTVGTASGTAPEPRFIDNSTAADLFTVSACVTNLLFPFVTNQAGFDTGIALVNTSLDNSGSPDGVPFDTTTQKGTCTVYYFGNMADGGATPAPQTTDIIEAGSLVKFSISGGGAPGAGGAPPTSSAAGFEGYIIARCNFQYAHGFAFINDAFGGNNIAHGYLALIIPDRGNVRPADPLSVAPANSGEQLAQ